MVTAIGSLFSSALKNLYAAHVQTYTSGDDELYRSSDDGIVARKMSFTKPIFHRPHSHRLPDRDTFLSIESGSSLATQSLLRYLPPYYAHIHSTHLHCRYQKKLLVIRRKIQPLLPYPQHLLLTLRDITE